VTTDSVQWILKKQKSVSLDLLAGFGQIFYRVLPKISRFPSESKVFAVRTCRSSVRYIFNYAFSKKNGEGTLRLPTVYSTHNIFDSKRF
jgi:hypothetical protein